LALKALLAGRPALWALLLGAASALALPPLHALPVLLLTIPAFLALLDRATGWKRAAWWGACFGFGHHLVGVYWVTHSLFTDIGRWFWLVPVAAPGLALPLALFAVLPALAGWWLRPGWPRVLGFAGAWVVSELLRGTMFSGFPWNLIGTGWAFHPVGMQGAALVGTHGLSALTMLLASLASLRGWRPLATGAALLAALLGFGAWRLSQPEPADTGVQLVVVQGNVAQDLKWDADQRRPIFERYLTLTARAAGEAAQARPGRPVVVVWPETASPFLLAQDAEAMRLAAAALPPGGLLLAGTVRADWDAQGRPVRLFNSLVALRAEGGIAATYDKSHLVPFGEYMPLGGVLPIRLVMGGMDFSAGAGPVTLALPGLPSPSPLICYEVIFPGRVAAAERPGWLLNITNDAWFGHSAGPHQHFAAARMRSVEEGLPMARAAQTGISAVVDARGRVLERLGLGATGTLTRTLPGELPATPFARFGRGIGFFIAAALISAAWWGNGLRKSQPKRV
jgi:apolipoprotein N-acyltransferase